MTATTDIFPISPEAEDLELRSILSHWERATDAQRFAGEHWFETAGEIVRELWPEQPQRALGIVAALSPRMQWGYNVVAAQRVIDAYRAGETTPPRVGLGRSVAAAWRIAQGEQPLDVLNGRKVRAFYRNLSGNPRAVTIDVWAQRVAGRSAKDGGKLTARQYCELAAKFQRAAKLAGTDPATMEATTWIVARGRES